MSAALSIRPATASDLPRCAVIWRDALNDYLGRLNLPEIPDQLEGIGRLHAHTLATDPDRFVVAEWSIGPGDVRERRILAGENEGWDGRIRAACGIDSVDLRGTDLSNGIALAHTGTDDLCGDREGSLHDLPGHAHHVDLGR